MKREAVLKVAKPILFNTDMVWAIQDGRKTETRRIVKPQPPKDANGTYERMDNGNFQLKVAPYESIYDYEIKPKYQVGDILYVRETWQYIDFAGDENGYVYKASENGKDWEENTENWTWKPSIHFPKCAARIFLRVTSVRPEWLQDIDDDGVVAEGLKIGAYFDELWDSTIDKTDLDKYGYNANPLVWVYGLELLEVE